MTHLNNLIAELVTGEKIFVNIDEDQAKKLGIPDADITAALGKQNAVNQLKATRSEIAASVGDTQSIVGSLADTISLLVAATAADIVALEENTTFAAYRTQKLETLHALAGEDANIAQLMNSLLTGIQSGDIILTAKVKGLENVMNDVTTRSTKAARVLAAAMAA